MAPGSLHDCTADFAAAPPRLVAESHYPESLQFLIIKLPKRPDGSFRLSISFRPRRSFRGGRNESFHLLARAVLEAVRLRTAPIVLRRSTKVPDILRGRVRDRTPRPRHCTARWAAHRSAGSDERERMDGDDSPSPLTKRPSDGGCCPATKASTVASSMRCPWTQWPTFGRTSSRGGRSSARWNRRFRTHPSSLPRWTR